MDDVDVNAFGAREGAIDNFCIVVVMMYDTHRYGAGCRERRFKFGAEPGGRSGDAFDERNGVVSFDRFRFDFLRRYPHERRISGRDSRWKLALTEIGRMDGASALDGWRCEPSSSFLWRSEGVFGSYRDRRFDIMHKVHKQRNFRGYATHR